MPTSSKTAQIVSEIARAGAITVMPDYFIDRFIRFDSLDDFVSLIKSKAVRSGGSIRGIPQSEAKGGNAVNLAYSLGKFGVKVNLITHAKSLSEKTLLGTFEKMKNVTVKVVEGRPGLTVAFEFVEGGEHVNVMTSDVGDVASFDAKSISEDSWKRIDDSKIVCVVNWASNRKGTELCERVFSRAKHHGAMTFFDPADLSGMREDILKLKQSVFDRGLVDTISVNENEARALCATFSTYKLPKNYIKSELEKCAVLISEESGSTVDIHTRTQSLSATGKDWVLKACHRVEQKIVTGAGDVWDAGDVLGYLLSWSDEKRLAFANAAAALYVSGRGAEPPSIAEAQSFAENERSYY